MTERPVPEIHVVGPGEPVAAVVGGVHGDEPCGVWAVHRLRQTIETGELELEDAVKLIVANPPAVAANKRFLAVDMNRSFPGDVTGFDEEHLASILCREIADIPTLTLHSTRSEPTPFAFADRNYPEAIRLVRAMSIPNLVLVDDHRYGSLGVCGTVVTVEAGRQGSDEAGERALALAEEFLIAVGALDGAIATNQPDLFEADDEIERPQGSSYEILTENFAHVPAGEAFARVDGEDIIAEEDFHPILMSADGYDDILGFRGRKLDEPLTDLSA